MARVSHAPHATLEDEARRLEVAARSRPLRRAFAARALKGITRLMGEMNDHALGEALSASSDVETLVRALEQPEASHALLGEDELLEQARRRGLAEKDRLLRAEGGVLSAGHAARHLRLSRQAVDKRRKAGTLLGLTLGRRGYAYPAWQFQGAGTLKGLEAVLAALKHQDPWMQAVFFLSPNPRLDDETPIKALRKGRLADVLLAARSLGEQGGA